MKSFTWTGVRAPVIDWKRDQAPRRKYQEDDETWSPSASRNLVNELSLAPWTRESSIASKAPKAAGIGIVLVIYLSIMTAPGGRILGSNRPNGDAHSQFKLPAPPDSRLDLVFLTSFDTSAESMCFWAEWAEIPRDSPY